MTPLDRIEKFEVSSKKIYLFFLSVWFLVHRSSTEVPLDIREITRVKNDSI